MRCLLADDFDDTREALTLCLQKAGWTVTAAKDGREALRLYHETIKDDEYFDLLILDIQMPRLNGIAVGVNVRNLERFSDIPRAVHVYLTGHANEMKIHGDELVAISFADAYFTKGQFSIPELLAKVTELTGQRRNFNDRRRKAG